MVDHDAMTVMARADLCRFLAACYYQPTAEFAAEKLFDSMVDVATQLDPVLAAHARCLHAQFSAEAIESLLVDYTRLFLGPAEIIAKPYGSVWLSGEQTLMQSSTMAVLELYGEGGFDIDESFRELPDHIAAELEFLYLLIYRENQAQRNGETQTFASLARLRKRFLSEHLGAWAMPFTAAVRMGAHTAFYRELAGLTERFVGMEARDEFVPGGCIVPHAESV
jgi:putative dimethyl sulfoxide reductase chaperone